MISRSITIADVVIVTGFSRHKLKGLFRELPGFDVPAEQARRAREFNRHELIVLAVCCELDERYGLKRATIGRLVAGIHKALNGPRTVASQAYLLIDIPTQAVSYSEGLSVPCEGLTISIGAILKRVDEHMEYGSTGPLNLGPVPIATSGQVFKKIKNSSKRVAMGTKKVVGAKR